MSEKDQIIAMLKKEFNDWEELVSGLSEEEAAARELPGGLSLKDVMAHLETWQQRSVLRMESGLQDWAPTFPGWPSELNPEADQDLEQVNAWIHETNRDRPWLEVYRDWREGFLRLIELAEMTGDENLVDTGKYPWLEGSSLADVLRASWSHHHTEHLVPLREWMRSKERQTGEAYGEEDY